MILRRRKCCTDDLSDVASHICVLFSNGLTLSQLHPVTADVCVFKALSGFSLIVFPKNWNKDALMAIVGLRLEYMTFGQIYSLEESKVADESHSREI